MNVPAQIRGLKGRHVIARGNAPGNQLEEFPALKGRNKISFHFIADGVGVTLTGLDWFAGLIPEALPRAIIFCPCRAGEGAGRA